ncbi:MAG: type II toxin-antitoxin system RatA family toxin [Alphaproteobacteria bacterium]
MTIYTEKRNLPYTPEQLFSLVADVARYPEFLPWCLNSHLTRQEEEGRIFYADLTVGYKMIRETFGSRVTLTYPHHIHVEYISGPMEYLSNHWDFVRNADGACCVDFYVDFRFKSKLLQGLMGVFFDDIVRRMVTAFEERAGVLYGAGKLDQ